MQQNLPVPEVAHRPSLKAQSDLDAIWDYIAQESGSAKIADNVLDSITERFYLIATYPKIGRVRYDDLGKGRRNYTTEHYIIVYRIKDKDIFILRVAHTQRDLKTLMYRTI